MSQVASARPRLVLAAALGALLALTGALALAGVAKAQRLPGFTERKSAAERQLERSFQAGASRRSAARNSAILSERPGLIATPGLAQARRYALATTRRYGLRPRLEDYGVYISEPKKIGVTMTAPSHYQARVKKPRFPWQRHFNEVVVGYNAYSPPGHVAGQLVYVNYGLP
jgi:N-acetylated-alpha-linked acidic dipeptidase